MVVVHLRHGGPQLRGPQELGHQNVQAVQVGELGCDDLEDGLWGQPVSLCGASCARAGLVLGQRGWSRRQGQVGHG